MIFVTVGTHEQPFNRLVEYMDKWAEFHEEDVVMQIGYSTYVPKHCKWQKLLSYQDIVKKIDEARIVITHGGPSSFIMPMQIGKTPIVVPRQHKYNEHVNDHQVKFAKEVEERMGAIITVVDVKDLSEIIENYERFKKKNKRSSNNERFNQSLGRIVDELFKGGK